LIQRDPASSNEQLIDGSKSHDQLSPKEKSDKFTLDWKKLVPMYVWQSEQINQSQYLSDQVPRTRANQFEQSKELLVYGDQGKADSQRTKMLARTYV
jgi:hypothetical protein